MPRQQGALLLKGTIGDKTYYKMGGQYLVRKKSSLDKERVKTDRAFVNSRKSSKQFGKAVQIAREVYYLLPDRMQRHGMIGKLTGMANTMLHEGKKVQEVKALLLKKRK